MVERSPECRSAVRCHALTAIVTDLLVTLVRERAVGGMVSLDDVERIAELLRRGTITLDEKLKAHEEGCRKQMLRPKGNVGSRSDPFQRLMVRPLEPLLAGDPPPLPRPYLANYIAYMRQAFGARLEQFEKQCKAIIQALLVVHGNNLTWDHFYGDPRTVRTLEVALQVVSRHLRDAEGRRLWHHCLAQTVPGLPPLPAALIEEIRATLLETHQGLAAAG